MSQADAATQLLVCAATLRELSAFRPPLPHRIEPAGFAADIEISFLLTGVGIPRALERVGDFASRCRPVRILNVGIAGAYPGSGLAVGDVVMAASEVYGDIGFELPEAPGFQAIQDVSFGEYYAEPIGLATDWAGPLLPAVRGCTVNTCTGTEATGRLRERLFGAAFETMEGAAAAQAGQSLGIPVTEIRAISNIAARRDMQPANIDLALERLAAYFHNCREASRA